MSGWMPQWYAYVPAVLSVTSKCCPSASVSLATPELNTTACGVLSMFVNRIVVPAFTVNDDGLNAKP